MEEENEHSDYHHINHMCNDHYSGGNRQGKEIGGENGSTANS
jgi:hypothetical protein